MGDAVGDAVGDGGNGVAVGVADGDADGLAVGCGDGERDGDFAVGKVVGSTRIGGIGDAVVGLTVGGIVGCDGAGRGSRGESLVVAKCHPT